VQLKVVEVQMLELNGGGTTLVTAGLLQVLASSYGRLLHILTGQEITYVDTPGYFW
jgi:hypothetical protein